MIRNQNSAAFRRPYFASKRLALVVALLPFSTLVTGQTLTSVKEKEKEKETDPIELSPFVVNQDRDSGYYASQTQAGGRLGQDIKDIGSSIQVINKEFMNDLGATGLDELLMYTTGTETAGILGNMVGADDGNVGEIINSGARNNPDTANRIRGLAAPDLARNFYKTSIPFDAYNTERIDINRGANSFLFGLGSPAGLINTSIAKALFRNENEVSTRIGTGGKDPTYRGSLTINREIIHDRLAIRLSTLMDRTQYRQEPTYKNDDRQFAAVTVRPIKGNTLLIRAYVENGRVRGNSAQTLLPVDNLSTFLDPTIGRLSFDPYDNLQRFNNAEGPTQAQYNALSAADKLKYRVVDTPTVNAIGPGTWGNGTWGLVYDGSNGALPSFGYTAQMPQTNYIVGDPFWDPLRKGRGNPQNSYYGNLSQINGTGWYEQGFTNLSMFDFSKYSLAWDNDAYKRDFFTYNITMEKTFWGDKAGIEVGFDKQDMFKYASNLFPFQSPILFDTNKTLLLPTDPNYKTSGVVAAVPNPNYGRPFTQTRQGYGTTDEQRESARLTAFFKIDFADYVESKWLRWVLGRHTFTGLADQNVVNFRSVNYSHTSFGDPDPAIHYGPANAAIAPTFARGVPKLVYLGPVQLNAITDPNFKLQDFVLTPATFQLLLPADYSIHMLAWNLGPDATRANIGQNSRANGNEGFTDVLFTPKFIPASGSVSYNKTTSFAINGQSYFLDNLLVVNTGYRQDTNLNKLNSNPPRFGIDSIPDVNPGIFRYEDGIESKETTHVFGYGGVLHWPDKLIRLPRWVNDVTFHYNTSENFIPGGGRVNELREPVVSPSGSSKDYGVTFYLGGNKLVARLNWYEAALNNASSSVSTTFQQLNQYLFTWYGNLNRNILADDANGDGKIDQALIDQLGAGQTVASEYPNLTRAIAARAAILPFLSDALKKNYNYQELADGGNTTQFAVGQITDVQDIVSKGFEADITYNPTKNWRIAFNAAKQSTALDNIAPRLTSLLNDVWIPHLATYGDLDFDRPVEKLNGATAFEGINTFGSQRPIYDFYTQKGQEGKPQNEQRKWRCNVITQYQFTRGALRGFSVGGAIRWQDTYAIGYPNLVDSSTGIILPDLRNPYWAETEMSYDLTIGYVRKIMKGIRWSAQLNIRNLQNWNSDQYTTIKAQPDGSSARVRFDPPMEMLLTNTFRF